ncbi:MAG: aminotransferase class IV [Deltaproteobacteria bacterium]|nr:aminotransferase class IV [Deltaproteobacteria bacterium]
MKEQAHINGRFADIGKAVIGVSDRGLAYGDGAFETILYKDGTVRLLKAHIQRLGASLKELGIRGCNLHTFESRIYQLIELNRLTRGCAKIKIIVERGGGGPSHLPPVKTKPVIIITATGLDYKKASALYSSGVSTVGYTGAIRALAHLKTLNYLPSVLAKAYAARHKAYDAIYITPKGRVLEASASNVFIVKDNTLITPMLQTRESGVSYAILPGVTRAHVLKVAMAAGFRVKEKTFTRKELLDADEVFLTNSITGILPVTRVDGKKVGKGLPGPVTAKLAAAYEASFTKRPPGRTSKK